MRHIGLYVCLLGISAVATAGAAAAAAAASAPAATATKHAAGTNATAAAAVGTQHAAGTNATAGNSSCSSERQVVMCSHIAGVEQRQLCCKHHKPVADPAPHLRIGHDPTAMAQSEAIALARTSRRDDLHPMSRPRFMDLREECFVPVQIPSIPFDSSKPVEVTTQFVPRLSTASIKRVKLHAFQQLPESVKELVGTLHSVDKRSGFVHPASVAGPAELALMQKRLQHKVQPQYAAQRMLLTGGGVRPKYYTNPETGRKWAPPTECSPEGYKGPYAIRDIDIDWGGTDAKPLSQRMCADSFDPNAPQHMCGHLSFVELDAVMAYKQAVAWWATGDRRHAKTAIDIIAAWTRSNSHFGMKTRNGPLEAGWGIAGEGVIHQLGVSRKGGGSCGRDATWLTQLLFLQWAHTMGSLTTVCVCIVQEWPGHLSCCAQRHRPGSYLTS